MINYFEWPLSYSEVPTIYLDSVPYNEAVWLTTHNSFVNINEGWHYHPQQSLNLTDQFNYGVRSFMIDIHKSKSQELILQHGENFSSFPFIEQFLGGVQHSATSSPGYVAGYLQAFAKLLKENPKEIITLHIESYVSNKDIKQALQDNGLGDYLLMHNPNDKEITLGEMRDKDQRLVVFTNRHDYADGILKPNDYKESSYSLGMDKMCKSRGEWRADFKNPYINLFIFNHFYTASCSYNYDYVGSMSKIVKADCDLTNEYKAILKRVNFCLQEGNFPNFIAVDFVERGNFGGAREVVRTMNSIGKTRMINDASSCSTKLKS